MPSNPDAISIVLVENVPQLLKHLQKTLGLMDGIELINTSMSAQEATEAIRDLKPEVALIEYNLSDMNGIALTELIRKDYPGTQVVLISQDNYTEIVLKAIRAGACDFITHDASVKEMTDVIRRAALLAAQDREKLALPGGPPVIGSVTVESKGGEGRVITVYSPKGGVGTTTIAANLALALIDMDSEARVVLVDGSMQYGDVHLLFNEIGRLSVLDLVPRVYDLDPQLVENVMLFNRPTGMYILPAPPRPEFAEKISGDNFARIIDYLRRFYDYIVINTDSYISDPVLAALDAGEAIILVTAQQINAIRSTRLFLDLWEAFGMAKERLSLVINRYNENSPITVEKVSERLKHPVVVTLPDEPEVTARADALGQPILRSSKNSELAQAILSLGEHAKKRVSSAELVEHPRMRLFSVS